MKRILKSALVLAIVAVVVTTLAACGSSFAIEGKWKNVGETTYGQVQEDAIVAFDGTNCNVFSPKDTYSFTKDGDSYRLDCTSILFADTVTFDVEVIDNDNIVLDNGTVAVELERVG